MLKHKYKTCYITPQIREYDIFAVLNKGMSVMP
jgi:hypothetical protein